MSARKRVEVILSSQVNVIANLKIVVGNEVPNTGRIDSFVSAF